MLIFVSIVRVPLRLFSSPAGVGLPAGRVSFCLFVTRDTGGRTFLLGDSIGRGVSTRPSLSPGVWPRSLGVRGSLSVRIRVSVGGERVPLDGFLVTLFVSHSFSCFNVFRDNTFSMDNKNGAESENSFLCGPFHVIKFLYFFYPTNGDGRKVALVHAIEMCYFMRFVFIYIHHLCDWNNLQCKPVFTVCLHTICQ